MGIECQTINCSVAYIPHCIWTAACGMIMARIARLRRYILVAVRSSGILKGKQKLGVTFDSDELGSIDFTKFSKLTMCSGWEEAQAITFLKISYVKFSPKIRIF